MLYSWNPSDKTADTILTGNNLSIQNDKAAYIGARGVAPKTSGKWYWEVTLDAYPGAYGSNFSIGVATSNFGLNSLAGNSASSAGLFIVATSDYRYGDGASVSVVSGGGVPASGHTFSVLLNADSNTLSVWVNGVNYTGVINMATGYGVALYPVITFLSPISSPMKFTANFGASAFKYPVPSGYKAIL